MESPLNIVIAAQNALFTDLVKAAVVANGHNLVAGHQELHSDQALEGCDILVVHLATANSVEINALEAIGLAYPNVGIVVLCVQSEVDKICDALNGTANAIIADDKPVDVLISALQIVSHGFNVVHQKQQALSGQNGFMAQNLLDGVSNAASDLLSERELTILLKVHKGFSNKEIARQFDISDSTVKAHLRSIFQKTGLRNRTQAAIWASSLLSPDQN